MIHADEFNQLEKNLVQDKNGNWHVAKPIVDSSILRRLIDAWKVLVGDYVAVKFWSDDEN